MTADPGAVTLREVNAENVRSICELSVSETQAAYVVSNAVAIAEACFADDDRLQAIYLDDLPVGLAVLRIQPDRDHFFLWRLMIDARYQGANIGRSALAKIIDYLRMNFDAREFTTSVVPGDDSPQGFYRRLGFEPTGEWFEGEMVMRLAL